MKVFVHCSDSPYGDAALIDEWHRARGWSGIGYHWVILNGHRKNSKDYSLWDDGLVEAGRPERETGSHARGHNRRSIGICLIGRTEFTGRQIDVLLYEIRKLKARFDVTDVLGHYEVDSSKTCPNLDMNWLRSRL